ncbi:MAG TPA: hypothetical protein VFA10_29125 [Ktedonobacteraceae bacterium]|jgi:uncharacterized protein|nr:hypothetical protein [Ktedonobacteraceae bacterium]
MVYIARLVWDSQNVPHIARHDVVPEEVEEVCHGRHIASQTYKKRILIIGPTQSGRMLAVVLDRTKKKNVYYPVTARPASKREIREYDDESR